MDKWLWCARFFKTRRLASDAVDGGKVKVGGIAVKPAKALKVGDLLHIRLEESAIEVVVAGFNEQRRPASEARLLYAETPESARRRAEAAALRALDPQPLAEAKGRPTKRDRRQLSRFREG
nr:S4 domain-containing protein [Rhodocyclus gracilis]